MKLLREHGGELAVHVNDSETIDHLKQKVREKHSIPVHCQRIKHRGQVVPNSDVIRSLRQPDSSIISLQLDVRYVLTINVYGGSSFDLEVSSHELVDTIMSAICRHSRMSFYRQEIKFENQVLESGRRISEYNVCDRAVLEVGLRNYQAMVFVKTLHGQTIALQVHAHDTVDQIKELIEQQEAIPAHKQRLVFVGEQLRGDNRFLDYNIEHESAVHLILREGVGFEVYVDTPGGKSYVVEVEPSDSVDQLKEKVSRKVDIPSHMQVIYMGSHKLVDSLSLGDNGVKSRSILRVAIAEHCARLRITLSTHVTFPVWVQLEQTVDTLRDIIGTRERVQARYVELFCGHTRMENAQSLNHYSLRHNQAVRVNIVRPVLMRLRVVVRGSPEAPLSLQEPVSGTILSVKETLAERLNGKVQDMQLFLEGRELEDGRTLHDSGVLDYATLDLIHSPSGSSCATRVVKNMHLFVKTLTGKSIMVDVSPSDLVLAIKEQIQQQEGVAIPRQCLVVGGRILDNNARLCDCSVQNQTVLHLVLRVPSQAPINVTVEGEDHHFTLSLMQGDSVRYLKEQVETRTGIARDQVRLLVNEQVLEEDSNSLADYQLEEDSVIQIQLLHHHHH